jgi:dimeric dUTPase (all-alpha-NTP-PPase superfamily)
MKLAIAIRTCDSVLNYWNTKRVVKANKPEIVLTCLHSLLKSIALSKHSIKFSIHDDSSSSHTIEQMAKMCTKFNVSVDFYNCDKLKNFVSQYNWIKEQDCEYLYCVEDDYLHRQNAIDSMVDMCDYMKDFFPGEYAIYPFNNPHRYNSFDMLYPSYIIKGKDQYWRSSFHSTHTFFISKKSFDDYDNIMKFQSHAWPSLEATEDKTINNIWKEQRVRLLSPLNSLSFHLADETQEDKLTNWQEIWKENLI